MHRYVLPFVLSLTAAQHLEADTAPFGDTWPGMTPVLIAPGVINSEATEINLVFNQDNTELFFSRIVEGGFRMYTSRRLDDAWAQPRWIDVIPEGSKTEAVDMALSPDDRLLYFLGITHDGETQQMDLWVTERMNSGWSEARRLGPEINTEHGEFYPVVVADGSLYFVRDEATELGPRNLNRAARQSGGGFASPVPVGPPIDTSQRKGDTYVSPDERYIIFSSNERGGHGSSDLFVSFRTDDGGWTEPRNMGSTINGPELEFCPMVSPDGRWFSFSRRYGDSWATTTDAEIYWMDAAFIETLR